MSDTNVRNTRSLKVNLRLNCLEPTSLSGRTLVPHAAAFSGTLMVAKRQNEQNDSPFSPSYFLLSTLLLKNRSSYSFVSCHTVMLFGISVNEAASHRRFSGGDTCCPGR